MLVHLEVCVSEHETVPLIGVVASSDSAGFPRVMYVHGHGEGSGTLLEHLESTCLSFSVHVALHVILKQSLPDIGLREYAICSLLCVLSVEFLSACLCEAMKPVEVLRVVSHPMVMVYPPLSSLEDIPASYS